MTTGERKIHESDNQDELEYVIDHVFLKFQIPFGLNHAIN